MIAYEPHDTQPTPNSLAFCVRTWRVVRLTSPSGGGEPVKTILAVVAAENAARVLCGLPEIDDGWKSYPGRKVELRRTKHIAHAISYGLSDDARLLTEPVVEPDKEPSLLHDVLSARDAAMTTVKALAALSRRLQRESLG